MPPWADPHKFYLGNDRFCSQVSDDELGRTCPSPGPLCIRCQQLDIRAYFLDVAAARDSMLSDENLLDTLDNISIRAPSCHFCTLRTDALRARSPHIFQDENHADGKPVARTISVFLKSFLVGIFEREEDRSVEGFNRQETCCIALYLDQDASEVAGMIRLLCNDAHLI